MIDIALLGIFLLVAVLQLVTLAVLVRHTRVQSGLPTPVSEPPVTPEVIDDAERTTAFGHKHNFSREPDEIDTDNGVAVHHCTCGIRTFRRWNV